MDLNEDCKLLILDYLPVFDLLLLARMNTNLFAVVEVILKQRFLNKQLIFRAPYESHELEDARSCVKEEHDHIQMTSSPVIFTTLKDFGHTISNLNVVHFMAGPKIEDQLIYESINVYCSETLSHFHLRNNGNDIFVKLTKPFKAVQQLSLTGPFKSVNNSDFSFIEIFPSLRQMNLAVEDMHGLDVGAHKIPHLDQLRAELWGSNNIAPLKQLIQINPQIRHLTLISVKPDLLEFVAEKLPHLENLQLEFYSEENVDVNKFRLNFEHLKSFIMTGNSRIYTIPSNIIFKDLEELEAYATRQDSTRLLAIVLKYKMTLKKLRLTVNLRNEEILQLANAGLNVIEMSIVYEKITDVECVIKLIEHSKQLKRLKLNLDLSALYFDTNFKQNVFETLQKRLSNEWAILATKNSILLERI